MKKLFYSLCLTVLCLLSGHVSAQTVATLSFDEFNIAAGQTEKLVINLDNDIAVWMMQFDLLLPEGLTIEEGSISETERIPGTHSLESNQTSSGAYRFLIYTIKKNVSLTGNSGAIVTMNIVASESFKSGTITATEILITNMNNEAFELADASLTFKEKIAVQVTANDVTRK